MFTLLRLAIFVVGAGCIGAITLSVKGDEPPRSKVELRWIERFHKEGVTIDRGVGDPDSPVFPHKTPALILAPTDVTEARLNQHDLLMNDVEVHNYSVTLILTKEARERLAANCPNKSARVMVAVDGKYWGWFNYTTDNDEKVSDQCKSKTFNVFIGLMSSKADAESVVDAFK